MSEFYNFSGSYIRLAGNSPTEFGSAEFEIQAAGKKVKFSYDIETSVAGETPFVTFNDRFIDIFLNLISLSDAAARGEEYELRLGQVDWGNNLSTTILTLDQEIGIITNRFVFALDGDPIPLLTSTSALEYNAFIRSATFGPASGEFGPGQKISLKNLDQARNEDPVGRFESGRFGQDNVLEGTVGADTITGADGRDVISGFDSADTLRGGGDNDVIIGGRGDDDISGNSGQDLLQGDEGNDKISGGGGKDTIEGGAGRDVLVGGGGADLFVFATGDGRDKIKKFDTSNKGDSINLADVAAIKGYTDLTKNHISEANGNVVITDGSGLRITLTKTDLSDLDQGDFLF
ncbi:MAG: calcium-binding protein [Arenibacterium sp.]